MDHVDAQYPSTQFRHQTQVQVQSNKPKPWSNSELIPPVQPNVRLRQLNFPILLMNLPLSLSARIPNNAYMEDLSPKSAGDL